MKSNYVYFIENKAGMWWNIVWDIISPKERQIRPEKDFWTNDPHKAFRFFRKTDPIPFIKQAGLIDVEITEHEFVTVYCDRCKGGCCAKCDYTGIKQ